MSLIGLMLQCSWRLTAAATLACLVGGACSAALIATLNQILTSGRLDASTGVIFGLLVAGKIAGSCVARWLSNRMVQRAGVNLRHHLSERIIEAPLWKLEQAGSSRVLSVLVEDIAAITTSLVAFPTLAADMAILIGCTVYLGILSLSMLSASFLCVVVGLLGFALLVRHAMKSLWSARSEQDRLIAFFHGLAEGSKELQLNRRLRHAFLNEDLVPAAESVRRHAVRAEDCFIVLELWTQFLFYVLIAAVLFILPRSWAMQPGVLTGYILTMLFLMRPIISILSHLPSLGRGNTALAHIKELSTALTESKPRRAIPRAGDAPWRTFTSIQLVGVTYLYTGDGDSFQLGPADLSFVPGELVFLVGGNGSGKSTLAKLIAGLYSPHKGDVRLNGVPISEERRDDYRQLFAAVFADSYLFRRVPDHSDPRRLAQAQRYLTEFRIDRKVTVEEGVFRAAGLSLGEQRRLALVSAYVEDRPFYIFDEWAANQDPQFKEIFYRQLLPELRDRGKTILVVSHDDRYFGVADRVLRLDEGMIVAQPLVTEAL